MAAHVEGYRGPAELAQFRGGQSNPTYLVTARSGRYVLRRKPPGPLLPSAHAIEREYRVQRALAGAGFPVARVHALEEDPTILGTAFYVMDHVAGRVFWEPWMPGSDPGERGAVYDAMNAALARLHSLDPAAIGLSDFGRPAGYVARQVRRWSEQYSASAAEPVDAMDRLMDWLPAHLPPEAPARVVHGDFRLDNLVVAPAAPQIAAVLDWELATLGDPIADFTYHLMQWHMPAELRGAGTASLAGRDLAALGIPALADYVARYEARTGLAVRAHLGTYLAYNFFRMAAILAGVAARGRAGNAASAQAALSAGEVRPLAEIAWQFARGANSVTGS
ncbi:phosphotransferase family protein [Rhizobiales bacterium L72]|uniref:Phosphotransferase family protein n=2 Tax=Propylenella binzhouense TaxID=2555902 RepID=A0A964WVC5_9HYPH|nr:phosphotransferase family protein [Propylenella binzhouense]MYZ49908.1 phosphotransferase family protein [Propylenella binzhouense]